MVWILLTILVSVSAGIYGEHRWPDKAGSGSRRGLLLILYFVLPPIVFFNIAHVELTFGGGAGIGAGILTSVCVGLLAWFFAVPVLKLERPVAGAVICSAILANTSYLGYPMVYTLMGGEALTNAVLFDVVVSYLTLMIGAFGVGAAFGTKAGEGFRERLKAFFLKNPILFAAILGLLAPDAIAPDIAVDISRLLVGIPLVVGFFAVGAILTEEVRDGVMKIPPRPHKPLGAVIICRLVIMNRGELLALGTPDALKAETVQGNLWDITVAPLMPALSALDDLAGVTRVNLAGDHLRVETAAGQLTAVQIQSHLLQKGFGVETAVAPTDPTLEDVFITLAGHDRR